MFLISFTKVLLFLNPNLSKARALTHKRLNFHARFMMMTMMMMMMMVMDLEAFWFKHWVPHGVCYTRGQRSYSHSARLVSTELVPETSIANLGLWHLLSFLLFFSDSGFLQIYFSSQAFYVSSSIWQVLRSLCSAMPSRSLSSMLGALLVSIF